MWRPVCSVKIYVCPACVNVIHSIGETLFHCHGVRKIVLYCNRNGLLLRMPE